LRALELEAALENAGVEEDEGDDEGENGERSLFRGIFLPKK